MGADLIVNAVPWPLDWVEDAVASLIPDSVDGVLGECMPWYAEEGRAVPGGLGPREYLLQAARDAVAYLEEGYRDVTVLTPVPGGPDVVVAGETSWGDVGEGFDAANLLSNILYFSHRDKEMLARAAAL